MVRISIVGSSGRHWTPAQRTKVIQKIRDILTDDEYIDHPFGPFDPLFDPGDIEYPTLVSGGCGALGEDEKFKFDPGVDGYAEMVADFIGLEKDIKYPDNFSREACGKRNREVARDCDILYCIDPYWRTWSGGMWTLKMAKEMGKETHLVLVE